MSARADAADIPIDDDEDGVRPETLREIKRVLDRLGREPLSERRGF